MDMQRTGLGGWDFSEFSMVCHKNRLALSDSAANPNVQSP